MIKIDRKEVFKDEISTGVTLVDFYADWCGPCKMLAPEIEALSVEMEGKAKVVKVNVDEQRELAGEYQVRAIPTLFVIKDGEVKEELVGYQTKDSLTKALERHI